MSSGKWSKYHELAYLYIAMAIADGDFNVYEQEEVFFCLRDWKHDLTKARFLSLYDDVHPRLLKVTNGLEHIRAVEKSLLRLKTSGLTKSRSRTLLLLEHLCRVARTDGLVVFKERLVLQAAVRQLELQKRVVLSFEHGSAEVRLS